MHVIRLSQTHTNNNDRPPSLAPLDAFLNTVTLKLSSSDISEFHHDIITLWTYFLLFSKFRDINTCMNCLCTVIKDGMIRTEKTYVVVLTHGLLKEFFCFTIVNHNIILSMIGATEKHYILSYYWSRYFLINPTNEILLMRLFYLPKFVRGNISTLKLLTMQKFII